MPERKDTLPALTFLSEQVLNKAPKVSCLLGHGKSWGTVSRGTTAINCQHTHSSEVQAAIGQAHGRGGSGRGAVEGRKRPETLGRDQSKKQAFLYDPGEGSKGG